MADISKITLPDGVTYDIKDATARNQSKDIFFVYAYTNEQVSDSFTIDLPIDDLVSDETIILAELTRDTIGVNQITFNVNLNNNRSYQNISLYINNSQNVFRGVFPTGTKFLITAWKNPNDYWFFFCTGGPIVTNRQTVETVLGTQTGSTTSWTGKMEDIALLEPGLKILYVLPYDCSGDITIQLAFMDDYSTNVHQTAIIPVYTDKETKLSGDFKAGQTFTLTYYPANSLTLGGDVIAEERFYCASGSTTSSGGGGEEVVDKDQQLIDILKTKLNGKKYGVHFDDFDTNPSPNGTRLYDAIDMSITPSTNDAYNRNDFEDVGPFAFVEVNGYVDYFGVFHTTAIKDVDSDFSRTTNDTWCVFPVHYIKTTIDSSGEDIVISDEAFDDALPCANAINYDGTIRPFIPISKYSASIVNNQLMSVSGADAANLSFSTSVTMAHDKGLQYCCQTAQDIEFLRTLFQIAFASRNAQTNMRGVTYYSVQTPATVEETDVERIIIASSNARSLIIGSCVSIGQPTVLRNGSPYIDRGQEGMHSKANRVIITAIEEYDSNNSAVYVDNGGAKFDTTSSSIDGIEAKTYLTNMPWKTGSCDNVKGVCGSPFANTSGKEPFVLFGVEMMYGYYDVYGNVIGVVENGVFCPYICYDCADLDPEATNYESKYTKVGYTLANTNSVWKVISKMGYDPNNPGVRFPIEASATSTSTGYCDAIYTNSNISDGLKREILTAGRMIAGDNNGPWLCSVFQTLDSTSWQQASRLSATGRSSNTISQS